MKNTDKDYFERFSFGDSPEMADELFSPGTCRKENGNSFGYIGG